MVRKVFEGQRVLITGSGSGLGRLMAKRFAELGANLVLWDIRKELIEETKELILAGTEHPVEVTLYQIDLSQREQIYETCDKMISDIGQVDVIINNAGIVSGKKFMECSDELIIKTFAVNTLAHFWIAKKLLPAMIERNKGHIVTIASAAATTGVVGLADYCASKWAAFGFNESIRMELKSLGKTGVHTTCVCPYYINTGMFDGVKTNFLLPILDPTYVTDRIINAVRSKTEVIYLPGILKVVYLLRALFPTFVWDYMANLLGISTSMSDFKGRGDKWALGSSGSNNNNNNNNDKKDDHPPPAGDNDGK